MLSVRPVVFPEHIERAYRQDFAKGWIVVQYLDGDTRIVSRVYDEHAEAVQMCIAMADDDEVFDVGEPKAGDPQPF